MAHPVVHWEIAAKDPAAAREFYSSLFGWKIESVPGMDYMMTETGGEGGINGGIMAPPAPDWPAISLYVLVEDLDACLKQAEALGGTTVVPPTPIPNIGAFAFFRDPQGVPIGIYKGEHAG